MTQGISIFRENSSIELVFFTTNKCSGICPYCFVNKYKDTKILRELEVYEVEAFLDFSISNARSKNIICYWQGAEATEFLIDKWKALNELMAKYKKRISIKNILVSGLFTQFDKILEVLRAFKFDCLSYSIDPLRGEDWHKEVSVRLDKIRQLNLTQVVNSCIIVLSDSVYGHESEIVKQYRKYGISRFRLREIVPRSKNDQYIVKNDRLLEIYKNFFKIYLSSNISFEPFESFLYEWRFKQPYGTCCFFKGCGNLLALRPGGEISVCDLSGELSQDLVFGTLENLDLVKTNIEIWRSRRPEKCMSCKFEKVCNGGCPARAYMMKSIQDEDPLCEVWYALREFAYKEFSKLNYNELQKLWKKSNFANIEYRPKLKIY